MNESNKAGKQVSSGKGEEGKMAAESFFLGVSLFLVSFHHFLFPQAVDVISSACSITHPSL